MQKSALISIRQSMRLLDASEVPSGCDSVPHFGTREG